MPTFLIVRVLAEHKKYIQEIQKRRTRYLKRPYIEWEVIQEMMVNHKKQEGELK